MPNQEIISRMPIIFARQAAWATRYFDTYWEEITNVAPAGRWFTIRDVAALGDFRVYAKGKPVSPQTLIDYIRFIFAYVALESGNEVLIREGNRYRWADPDPLGE